MANRKIIKIKRSARYSDRIIIILDDKSVFRVPEDVFILNITTAGATKYIPMLRSITPIPYPNISSSESIST